MHTEGDTHPPYYVTTMCEHLAPQHMESGLKNMATSSDHEYDLLTLLAIWHLFWGGCQSHCDMTELVWPSLQMHFKVAIRNKQVIPSQMCWGLSVYCGCKMNWAGCLLRPWCSNRLVKHARLPALFPEWYREVMHVFSNVRLHKHQGPSKLCGMLRKCSPRPGYEANQNVEWM